MKPETAPSEETREMMDFVIFKSYDGGKKWERERECRDFMTAVDIAQALRVQHPSIRFRVDVEAARRRSTQALSPLKGGRMLRRSPRAGRSQPRRP